MARSFVATLKPQDTCALTEKCKATFLQPGTSPSAEAGGGNVEGNITAANLKISGRVKGNIEVSGRCALDSTSILHGNSKAKIFAVEEGASHQRENFNGTARTLHRRTAPSRFRITHSNHATYRF
jgi:cytoskeletal protein CcmA (bactofilin family)